MEVPDPMLEEGELHQSSDPVSIKLEDRGCHPMLGLIPPVQEGDFHEEIAHLRDAPPLTSSTSLVAHPMVIHPSRQALLEQGGSNLIPSPTAC